MAGSHLPPGFRFHPTDEELLVHYLKRKALGKFVDEWVVGEIDIYKYEPVELPEMAVLRTRDSEWFFFNAPDKKQLNASRTNRTTKGGYWKATGKDRRISVGSCVGMKKTLIYYCGRAPHGDRTDWVMHEFRLDDGAKKKMKSTDSVVLCRVRRKSGLGPRNGEDYGAPVLEDEEDVGRDLANYTDLLPCISERPMDERPIQEAAPVMTVLEDSRGTKEDFNIFLQNFLSFEDLQQEDHNPKEDLVVDELLRLLKDQSDGALTPTATSIIVDAESCSSDNNPLNEAEYGSIELAGVLDLVSGQPDVVREHLPGLQMSSQNFHTDHLQRVGFLELADLDEPCQNQSSLQSAALDNLLLELDAGMEFSISTGLAQDELQLQRNLQQFDHREDIRDLLRFGGSGMNNESEVRLDSSQSLSVLESVHTRSFLRSDDDGVPSGLALCSCQEKGLALSHSQGTGAEEQPEVGHAVVDKYIENGNPSPGSHRCMEHGAYDSERNVSNGPQANKSGNLESASMADDNNHSLCLALRQRSPSTIAMARSPSTIARLISMLLAKIDALPASAEELPLERRWQLPKKESTLSCVAASGARPIAFMDSAPSSSCGSSLSLKVELLSPFQHGNRISGRALPYLVSSMVILDGHRRRFVKSFNNAASTLIFCITTLVVVLTCMFRSFYRSTSMISRACHL